MFESEVGRVKITVEVEGKDTVTYEFPRVKEFSLVTESRWYETEPWKMHALAEADVWGMDFSFNLLALKDRVQGNIAIVERVEKPGG